MTPLRQWLRLFVPVALGVGVAAGTAAVLQHRGALRGIEQDQMRRLALADEALAHELLDAALDLRVIAGAPALQSWAANPLSAGSQGLEQLLHTFVEQKPLLDAVTVFGFGPPLRVQRSGAGVRSAAPDTVDAREQENAVAVTRELPPQAIHLSRTSLLRDAHGRARPYQPVLQLAIARRVAGRDLVITTRLRGSVLLRRLQDLLADPAATTWLLDHEGYWLSHPDPQMLWGFELNDSLRLDRRLPQLATMLDRVEGTQADGDGGLLVFGRLRGLNLAAAEAGLTVPGPWLAVQRLPAAALPPRVPALPLALACLALLAWAGTCWAVVRLRVRAVEAEDRSLAMQAAQQRSSEDQAWVRQHIFDLGLRINAAPDLRRFGEAFLAELAPSLGLAAACLYRVQDGRCLAVASFGMARQDLPREFAPGQGLVGEVARTRRERRLHPVPDGYLDLAAGLGNAAVAELRIVPLWVHEVTFGVLELACIQRPDGRQEALLQQLTPVLALNLAGRGHALRPGA